MTRRIMVPAGTELSFYVKPDGLWVARSTDGEHEWPVPPGDPHDPIVIVPIIELLPADWRTVEPNQS